MTSVDQAEFEPIPPHLVALADQVEAATAETIRLQAQCGPWYRPNRKARRAFMEALSREKTLRRQALGSI